METGEALVSIAGPAMNFIIAIILTIVYLVVIKFANGFLLTSLGTLVDDILMLTISINIGLGVFNLIPLPPLDGSKIFIKFLPYKAKEFLYRYEQIFYFIFLVIWITGIASYIVRPVVEGVFYGMFWAISKLFGF